MLFFGYSENATAFRASEVSGVVETRDEAEPPAPPVNDGKAF